MVGLLPLVQTLSLLLDTRHAANGPVGVPTRIVAHMLVAVDVAGG